MFAKKIKETLLDRIEHYSNMMESTKKDLEDYQDYVHRKLEVIKVEKKNMYDDLIDQGYEESEASEITWTCFDPRLEELYEELSDLDADYQICVMNYNINYYAYEHLKDVPDDEVI